MQCNKLFREFLHPANFAAGPAILEFDIPMFTPTKLHDGLLKNSHKPLI